jgi:hypothetical protein
MAEADRLSQPCLKAPPCAAGDFSAKPEGILSVILYGSLQIEIPALKKEKPMEPATSSNSITNDVLHLGSQSKLSPEEIEKAMAHHKRRHGGDQPEKAAAHAAGSKRGKSGK